MSGTVTIGGVVYDLVLAPHGTPAGRAYGFSRTFGLNTHVDFQTYGYTNIPGLINALKYIWDGSGVAPQLRDSPANDQDLSWWSQISSATGARWAAFIGECPPSDYQGFLDRMGRLRPILSHYEGPNEPDSAAVNGYSGGLSQIDALLAAAAFMPKVFAAASGKPVINMSFGQGWSALNSWHGNYDKVGDLSASCTYANPHTYPAHGAPPSNDLLLANTDALLAASKRPCLISEFGYPQSGDGAVPDETMRCKYLLLALAEAYLLGNVGFWWYAAVDDMSGTWGLFNVDWTPRGTAIVIRNMLAILADTAATAASFTPTNLSFRLSGLPNKVGLPRQWLLLQKSDGSFWLVIWNEGGAVSPATSVALGLDKPAKSIQIFDPLLGRGATSVWNNVAGVTINVPDYPVVVSITL